MIYLYIYKKVQHSKVKKYFSFTLAGLSQREQLGRKKRLCNTCWLHQMEFSRQGRAVQALAVLSGAESCSVWVQWNSKKTPKPLNIMSFSGPPKPPCPPLDAAVAQITLSKAPVGQPKEPVVTTAYNCQHILFLGQTKGWSKKESEKKENVTAAQSVGAQRHCWLMY